MLTLPPAIMACLDPFSPVFSKRVWQHVLVLIAGAILTPSQRIVTSILRVTGLSQVPSFQCYHRVLNRDVWSSLQLSHVLLRLLVAAFVPTGPLVFRIDGTIERRRGAKIEVEVTFHEARQHLGLGTQRHWSDHAIARTTPALFGLFSLVTLLAHQQLAQREWLGRQAAWYSKTRPTFSDALALVRQELWAGTTFQTSWSDCDLIQIPRTLVEHLTETLCNAA